MLNTMELCHSADNINFTQVEEVLWATFLDNSEQWFLFLAVSNLLVNCWPTGYRHITDSRPTVSRQGFLGALLHNYH